jgi:hypothetical protein
VHKKFAALSKKGDQRTVASSRCQRRVQTGRAAWDRAAMRSKHQRIGLFRTENIGYLSVSLCGFRASEGIKLNDKLPELAK